MTRTSVASSGLIAVLAGLAGVTTIGGCAGKGDIDRSQPDKLDKALFFNADGSAKAFFYRWTITDVPPTNGWTFEGMQGSMDKIRFKITEDQLIGYRTYDYAPGTENAITGGANNTDAPVIAFKIKTHFDVKREYNPGTGEQTNVISENTTDRDWSARQFMRVDWSTDKLANPLMDVTLQPTDGFGSVNVGNSAVSEVDITNPARAVFTKDYLDVTIQAQATPDYAACMRLAAPDDVGPWGCGPAKIGLRHSFMAVKDTEYEPLDYPDRQPLLDAAGKPISVFWASDGPHSCVNSALSKTGGTFSGADCSQVGADQFSKFGFFRTVRQFYDRKVGAVELTRQYLANRWNIWDKTILRDAAGAPALDPATGKVMRIPDSTRAPRQIPYYLNVEFPDDDKMLLDSAQQVVGEWNDAMKRTVAALRTVGGQNAATEASVITAATAQNTDQTPRIPDIFVLKQNTCNLAGVKQYLNDHPDMAAELKDKTAAVTPAIDPTNLDKTTLVPTCTALEALTQALPDDDAKKFSWQRNGDLRYSFVYWVDRPQGSTSAPLGYGPSSSDPETGEIISATLYLYGAALDTYTQFAADSVDVANGNLMDPNDILSGKRLADVLKETAANRQKRDAFVLTPEARDYAHTLAATGGLPGVKPGASNQNPGSSPGTTVGSTSASRLVKVDPFAVDTKLASIKGTALETQMMTQDILVAFVPGYIPGRTSLSDITPEALAKASPVNWLSEGSRQARRDRFQKLSMNGCVYTADFADDAILGTALNLKNLSGDALFKTLRASIFRGLADHEMGHTMGLRHNFAGSTDALNYGKTYWDIRANVPEAQWPDNSLPEHQYSTVMDYGSRFNTDVHGLGRYDYAAIRFAYGQLIDVMPNSADYAGQLSYDLFFQDYRKIPSLVSGDPNVGATPNLIDEVSIMRYATAVDALQTGYRNLETNKGSFGILPERPYKFCSDEFEGNLDCKVWDMGANQKEIVNNVIDLFKNYYSFNGYQRGRLGWSINSYLTRLSSRYFNRFSEAFQFYYFFGDAFYGSDIANDLLSAAMLSLNTLGEILETPEPGQHCATDSNPDLLVVTNGYGPETTCHNDAPQMSIGLPDGKPYYIDFSDDYYYRVTRAGSLYEKLAALNALTSTQSRFFRVDNFADQDRYSINYYRLFKDQMLNLLSGIIRDDPTTYGGYVSNGAYKPSPVVDPATFGKATYPTPEYMLPNAKRVDTPVNKTIRYYALGLALAQLDSTWDSTLDFSAYVNVTLKGSNDDVTYSPGTIVTEYADPQSHLVYRAAQLDPARPGIGVTVLQELNQIVGVAGTPGTLPKKYGTDGGQPLPTWTSAKANVDAAKAAALQNTDATKTAALQTAYTTQLRIFNLVDYLLNFRVDLLGDIRTFRHAFGY